MRLRALFFACTYLFSPVSMQAQNSPTTTTQELDKELQALKSSRDAMQLKADTAARSADRIMTEDWMEYRHEIERQEELQRKIVELDKQIGDLEKQKADLEAKLSK